MRCSQGTVGRRRALGGMAAGAVAPPSWTPSQPAFDPAEVTFHEKIGAHDIFREGFAWFVFDVVTLDTKPKT